MCVIYFVWYFSIFLLYFSKILATNIDSITSYSKIREEIKSMYVCMYVSGPPQREESVELVVYYMGLRVQTLPCVNLTVG